MHTPHGFAAPCPPTPNHPHTTRPPSPAAYALGFLNCDDISARCMLSIFQFFATKTDASALRMLNGVPALPLPWLPGRHRFIHSLPSAL